MNSPFFEARLRDAGIEDVFDALLTRARTFLICPSHLKNPILRYYQSRRGVAARIRKLGTSSAFNLYRVEPVQRGVPNPAARPAR